MDTLRTMLMDYGAFGRENWPMLALTAAAVALVMISGGVAGSVAEQRNRGRLLHVLIGIVVPIVYPAIILFSLPYKERGKKHRARKEKAERVTKMEGAPPPDAPPVLSDDDVPPEASEELMGSAKIEYDQVYFKQVMYDDRGNYRGPFNFVVDGNEFKVERIIQVLESVVMIENFSSDGKTQHLRIPYSRIQSCTELD